MSPEKPRETSRIQEVARAILITSDGYMCIGKRSPGTFMAGYWCLIGGKAEGNLESELLREISEETGLPENILLEMGDPTFVRSTVRHSKRNGRIYRNNYFILEIDDSLTDTILESFNRAEFSQLAFISPEDIAGLRFAFGDGKIVREFFKYSGI